MYPVTYLPPSVEFGNAVLVPPEAENTKSYVGDGGSGSSSVIAEVPMLIVMVLLYWTL